MFLCIDVTAINFCVWFAIDGLLYGFRALADANTRSEDRVDIQVIKVGEVQVWVVGVLSNTAEVQVCVDRGGKLGDLSLLVGCERQKTHGSDECKEEE